MTRAYRPPPRPTLAYRRMRDLDALRTVHRRWLTDSRNHPNLIVCWRVARRTGLSPEMLCDQALAGDLTLAAWLEGGYVPD